MKQFLIIACGWEWADSCLGAHRTVFVSTLTGCRKSLCAQTERRNKSMRGAFLQWAVSGVGLPCGKARLFRWKMVLRLVSPALARGCPACRTAWFMRVVISAVATWINHVARIKLLLNDAQHFPRCLNLRVVFAVTKVVMLMLLHCGTFLSIPQWSSWGTTSLRSSPIADNSHDFTSAVNRGVGWWQVVGEWHEKLRRFEGLTQANVTPLNNFRPMIYSNATKTC